jgi:hypothetical protein
MSFWHIKDYAPDPPENPIRDWYEGQEDEVQLDFDYALHTLAETYDWTTVKEFRALKGRYLGLYEVAIDVKSYYWKKKRYFRPIGVWQPDSSDFIILLVCEKKAGMYTPPLSRALEMKSQWEKGGTIYDREV